MKNRIIYLAIILFLLSTNIATVISINSNKEKNEVDLTVARQPRESRMNFLWNELGLDENQIQLAIDSNSDYQKIARAITNDLTDLRHKIVEEMSAPVPDKDRLDDVINEFGRRHSELKRATVDYYYELYSVCDSQQRERLEYLFRDMLDPDGMIYGRGRGGQGRGKQFESRGPQRGRFRRNGF